MPLEAIACTNCGSVEIQELKPGTFFCHHCEGLFKHIDPSRITVQPRFCVHGEPIEVQCQICRTGMCRWKCDFADGRRLGRWWRIPTAGFGYLFRAAAPGGLAIPVTSGPFLFHGDLKASLTRTHGPLNHLCYTCLTAAVPSAAALIAAHAVCEFPGCSEEPCETCYCCQGKFCRFCCVAPTEGIAGATIRPAVIWVIAESPYCQMCQRELKRKIMMLSLEIITRDYAGSLVASEYGDFEVPVTKRLTLGGRIAEGERAAKVARQYADQISTRVSQLVRATSCDRQQDFLAGETDSTYDGKYGCYAILDERNRVPATAAGDMIGEW